MFHPYLTACPTGFSGVHSAGFSEASTFVSALSANSQSCCTPSLERSGHRVLSARWSAAELCAVDAFPED